MNETIAQNEQDAQSATINRAQRERKIKKLITKYEETIFAFFREIKLNVKYREIVRAFIIASGGETIFEASYSQLTNLLFQKSVLDFEANRASVSRGVKKLLKWQEERQIQLIRLIEEGRKKTLPDGSEEYLPSRYELVMLDELVKVLHEGKGKGLEQRIKEAVARIKGAYVPEPERARAKPITKMYRWRKSAFTFFGKTLQQAEDLGMNPIEFGRQFLSDLSEAFCEIEEQYDERQNRARRIADFYAATSEGAQDDFGEQGDFENAKLVSVEMEQAYENEGVRKDHIEIRGKEVTNLSTYKRPLLPVGERGESREYLNPTLDNLWVESENQNLLLDAALRYARAGYAVFPLQNPFFELGEVRCSCRDWKTCEKVGKHPRTRHGLLDATTDVETIREWWRRWPQANIGLLTGRGSNLFVLDVDPRSGGDYSLEHLEDSYGELTPTLTAITGSGGRHLFFNYPDVKIRNSASLIAGGLDVKSDNGYVVAAPSVHASGGLYEFHGVNTPILDAPDWLIALILIAEEEDRQEQGSAHKKDGAIRSATRVTGEAIKEGDGRNDYLFRQARGLVNTYAPEEVRRRIEAKNLALCVPPITDKELTKLLKSAERYRNQSLKAA